MHEPIDASQTLSEPERGSAPGDRISLTRPQRWFSLAEFVVGSAIVIGHNVYHVLPNEVPILFVIGLISLRVRDGGWRVIGLGWPACGAEPFLCAGGAAVRVLRQPVVDFSLRISATGNRPVAQTKSQVTRWSR